jgi:uncharacterized protein (TIGR00369 family)
MPNAIVTMPEGYEIYDPIDPFENNAGPFFYNPDLSEGLEFALLAEERHCNTHGIVHGGLMMTMADLSICVTARQGTDDDYVLTVSMNSDFISAGNIGDLITARADVVRRTGSLTFVDCKVRAGAQTLLNCSAVVKRMRKKG